MKILFLKTKLDSVFHFAPQFLKTFQLYNELSIYSHFNSVVSYLKFWWNEPHTQDIHFSERYFHTKTTKNKLNWKTEKKYIYNAYITYEIEVK